MDFPNQIIRKIEGNFGVDDAIDLVSFLDEYPEIRMKLDISRIGFFDPGSIAVIKLMNKKRPNSLELINASDGISKLLGRIHFNEKKLTPGTIFPLKEISTKIFDGYVNVELQQWIKTVLGRFYGASKNASASQIEIAAIEMINNVIDHSDSPFGGILCGASFKNRSHIILCIVDFGKSIPGTLRPLMPSLTDEELLVKAMEFGISRRKGVGHNYGRGLDTIKTYAISDPDSALLVVSGNGFLSVNQQKIHVRRAKNKFNGTFVKLSFSENYIKQSFEENSETVGFDL